MQDRGRESFEGGPRPGHLVDVVLLAEGVKDDVDLVQHVHHLHGCDVNANFVELYHITEQDGDIRKYLTPQR